MNFDMANEVLSVKLVKNVVAAIESKVRPGEYELRKDARSIINSVKVLSFRSFVGKTWGYAYYVLNEVRSIHANDVVFRKVSVYDKVYNTIEYPNGKIMTLPNRKIYKKWSDFLRDEIDRLAVRHQIVPLGISRNGVFAGQVRLEN